MRKLNLTSFIVFLLSLNIAADVTAQETKNSNDGFLDFNFYPYLNDVDNDSVVTINIAANLPRRLSYFSLTNFSNQDNRGELEDTTSFYTEQNLRWEIGDNSSIDLTAQYNLRSGIDNDRLRFGFRWRLNDYPVFSNFFNYLSLQWSINFHLLQLDHEDAQVWQMEHVFMLRLPKVSERLYLGGFIDHTFNEDLPADFPGSPVVGEVQLGYRLANNFYAVVEYRINEYRRSDTNNLAAGIEYKIKW